MRQEGRGGWMGRVEGKGRGGGRWGKGREGARKAGGGFE